MQVVNKCFAWVLIQMQKLQKLKLLENTVLEKSFFKLYFETNVLNPLTVW